MSTDDPRVRRSRDLIRASTRSLMEGGDGEASAPLRFSDVATAAGLNRGTLHSHYGSVDQLLVDALAPELDALRTAMCTCPFNTVDVPKEMHGMFLAARGLSRLIAGLTNSEQSVVRAAVAQALEDAATRGSPQSEPTGLATRFICGGLADLLLNPGERESTEAAQEAWVMIRAVLRCVGRSPR